AKVAFIGFTRGQQLDAFLIQAHLEIRLDECDARCAKWREHKYGIGLFVFDLLHVWTKVGGRDRHTHFVYDFTASLGECHLEGFQRVDARGIIGDRDICGFYAILGSPLAHRGSTLILREREADEIWRAPGNDARCCVQNNSGGLGLGDDRSHSQGIGRHLETSQKLDLVLDDKLLSDLFGPLGATGFVTINHLNIVTVVTLPPISSRYSSMPRLNSWPYSENGPLNGAIWPILTVAALAVADTRRSAAASINLL